MTDTQQEPQANELMCDCETNLCSDHTIFLVVHARAFLLCHPVANLSVFRPPHPLVEWWLEQAEIKESACEASWILVDQREWTAGARGIHT
jgi:hypothetical protein